MGMIGRRFALALGLMLALVASQLPEFVQQYRQRLGGALDEVRQTIAAFDAEAKSQSVSRDAGISRLKGNADPLAQARGADVEQAVLSEQRLAAQERGFAEAGPVSQYWVFASELDPGLAAHTYEIFQPALPASASGFVAGAVGLGLGWGGARMIGAPFRRRRTIPA